MKCSIRITTGTSSKASKHEHVRQLPKQERKLDGSTYLDIEEGSTLDFLLNSVPPCCYSDTTMKTILNFFVHVLVAVLFS